MTRKLIAVVLLIVFAFAIFPSPAALAGGGDYKDTPFDKLGDWMATLGKSGLEKDQILAERQAARLKRHAEIQAKKAKHEAEKAGKDMKEKMGY